MLSRYLNMLFHLTFGKLIQERFSTNRKVFDNQGIFPQSGKLSTIREFFHGHRRFPQSGMFSASKDFFLIT